MAIYTIVDEAYEVTICKSSKELMKHCEPSDNGFYVEVVGKQGRIEIINERHFNKVVRGATRFYVYPTACGDWEYKVTKHT